MQPWRCLPVCLFVYLATCQFGFNSIGYADDEGLKNRLAKLPLKLVFESYQAQNWELFVVRADGTGRANLTNTPKIHELYPQVSPNGQRVCFLVDQGRGRRTVRSLWVMDIDGKNRAKVSDHARQPCWSPDSKTIAYLPQEYPRFNIVDYFSKGLVYYDVETKNRRPHVNTSLHHLYNPCFAPNGKWIVATVHAGMGFSHAILLIEAEGTRVIDLKIGGCRPCLSTDGRHLAWGEDDHTISVAKIDLDAEQPRLGSRQFKITDSKNKIYHVDWSPDGKFLSLSRGPNGKGDLTKPGTHEAACEMVGVYATGWDVGVVAFRPGSTLDLNRGAADHFLSVTRDGRSNKEPAWFRDR